VNAISGSSNAALSAAAAGNSLNGSAAQILAPYAAAAAAAATGFPNDVLGMMPYFYPGLAGYYPGAGIPFMQPPGILPGTSSRYVIVSQKLGFDQDCKKPGRNKRIGGIVVKCNSALLLLLLLPLLLVVHNIGYYYDCCSAVRCFLFIFQVISRLHDEAKMKQTY